MVMRNESFAFQCASNVPQSFTNIKHFSDVYIDNPYNIYSTENLLLKRTTTEMKNCGPYDSVNHFSIMWGPYFNGKRQLD